MKTEPAFVKFPEIPHLMEILNILDSDSLEVYEKLDGGNTQIRNYKGRIFTGSRANFLNREENFRFDWFKNFNRWAKSNYSLYNLPENLIVYGEFMSHHTIPYSSKFVNKFFLIDIYDLEKEKFISYKKAKDNLEKRFGVKDIFFLETLAKGRLNLDQIKTLATGESRYTSYGREGVVVKDYEKQKFAKLWETSVNQTKKGLIKEIKKTLLSLQIPREYKISSDYFASLVYGELKRSGRKNISLTEISETIKEVVNKI